VAATRRKTWDTGNVFAVPLCDGTFTVGQVIGLEAPLNSITVALYRTRHTEASLTRFTGLPTIEDLLALQFTTKDALTRRRWRVLGNHPVPVHPYPNPYEHLREHGWVGAKVVGSGNLVNFLEAYFRLSPWDQMLDPTYFDRLLVHPSLKPSNVVLRGPGN
jgi:hypothetical protein